VELRSLERRRGNTNPPPWLHLYNTRSLPQQGTRFITISNYNNPENRAAFKAGKDERETKLVQMLDMITSNQSVPDDFVVWYMLRIYVSCSLREKRTLTCGRPF